MEISLLIDVEEELDNSVPEIEPTDIITLLYYDLRYYGVTDEIMYKVKIDVDDEDTKKQMLDNYVRIQKEIRVLVDEKITIQKWHYDIDGIIQKLYERLLKEWKSEEWFQNMVKAVDDSYNLDKTDLELRLTRLVFLYSLYVE